MNLYSVLFGDVVIPDDRQVWKAQAYHTQAHQPTQSLSAKYGQNVFKLKNGHHAQTSKSQQ